MQVIKIQFKNWEKYQPRKDYKNPWWFAMSNSFPVDQKLADFTNDEKLCLIYLLCESSKQASGGNATINVNYWCRIVGISTKTLLQVIEKIESVQIAYRTRTESVPTEQNITKQNKTEICVSDETPQSALRVTNSELEAIYSEYPKRLGNQGKADAFKSLMSIFNKDTSLGIYQDVLCSVRAYKSFCSRNGLIGTEKVAMFSTFFGRKQLWKDWIGSETSHQPSSLSDEEFRRLAFGGTSEQP